MMIVETAEDNHDYDSNVEAKTKKSRKILTGNGTYLFYNDSDTYTSMYSHLLSRKESAILSNRKASSGVYNSHNDPIPSSVTNVQYFFTILVSGRR